MKDAAGFWELNVRKKCFYPACDYPAAKKRFVKAAGARFWVEIEGEGKPLVLIHGGPGGNHCYFHPGMSLLARSRKLIYYDLRGHYMSCGSRRRDASAVLRDAVDLESLRRALSLGTIDVLGHSYGGIVAFLYALNYQRNLGKAIFCSTPVDVSEREIDERLKHNRISRMLENAKSDKERAELYYKLYFRAPVGAESRRYNDITRRAFCSRKNRRLLAAYENDEFKMGWERDMRKIGRPMLFVFGRYDPLSMIEKSRRAIGRAPNAEIEVFAGSGHDPFADEPQKFSDVVEKFLL